MNLTKFLISLTILFTLNISAANNNTIETLDAASLSLQIEILRAEIISLEMQCSTIIEFMPGKPGYIPNRTTEALLQKIWCRKIRLNELAEQLQQMTKAK